MTWLTAINGFRKAAITAPNRRSSMRVIVDGTGRPFLLWNSIGAGCYRRRYGRLCSNSRLYSCYRDGGSLRLGWRGDLLDSESN